MLEASCHESILGAKLQKLDDESEDQDERRHREWFCNADSMIIVTMEERWKKEGQKQALSNRYQ